jgi:hypothetical protein
MECIGFEEEDILGDQRLKTSFNIFLGDTPGYENNIGV